MERLVGKRALITGASRGLGRELALRFAEEGASHLALTGRDRGALAEAASAVRDRVPETEVLTIVADLAKDEDVERVAALTLSAFGGRLDVLVNNASTLGATPMPFLLDYPLEDFRRTLNVNLIAPFLLIKKLLPAMIECGGSIINVTSDAGVTGYPGWGAYGISKFGLEGLSQTWAAELEDAGVRVNWVDPGNMNTDMHRAAEPEEDPSQWADPALVTEVFVYLASEESKGATGQRLQAQEEGWGLAEEAQAG
jgi:NAD(P)-dependent dehydrogenase (short-subunit alcohol dehydrogenase family)